MAPYVSARSTADVTALLRAVRRELWSRRLVDETVRGLWWLAVATLVLGLTHRWISSVDPRFAAVVGCLPALVLIGIAVVRGRPSLASCARRADQWFHGKEIMVSAWELSRPNDSHESWTTEIVRSRARNDARKWLHRLPRQRTDLRQRSAIPVSIGLAGIFLLMNPGGGSNGAVVVPSSGRTAPLSEIPVASEIRPAIEPHRDTTAMPSLPSRSPDRAQGSGGEGARVARQSAGEPDPGTRESEGRTPTATTAQATGRGVSDQPRGRADGEWNEPIPAMNIRFISVPAPARDSAGAPGAGRAALLDAGATLEQAPAPDGTRSAGADSDTRRFNEFSPALRSYVAIYMQARIDQK